MPTGSPESYAIGIDLGGTKCAAGLVALRSGEVVARHERATAPQRGAEALFNDVLEMIALLISQGAAMGAIPGAIGIGIAELVDASGKIASAATIPWSDFDPVARVSQATGLPTSIDADVRAAAKAEATFGHGRGAQSLLYVTVGTGISACLVIDGIPYRGARGLTGTFASQPLPVATTSGDLIETPALENFASGPALAARMAAAQVGFRGTSREVIALAEADDAVAARIVTTAGEALGVAIGQLVNVVDPELIALGGGLGLVEGFWRAAIEVGLRAGIWSDLHRDIPLVSARLGNDAGLIGAALIAVNSLNRR